MTALRVTPGRRLLEGMDSELFNELLDRAVTDVGACASTGLIAVGERTGLFAALRQGPATPAELARRSGTAERYVREWACALAAGGYLTHDGGSYTLNPEQRVLLDPDGPVNLPAAAELGLAIMRDTDRLERAFRTGEGIGWGEHDEALHAGVAAFYRPGYAQHLVDRWLPALDGVADRLRAGGSVADIGCGHGAATVLIAEAFPAATVTGFDAHPASVAAATAAAAKAGVRAGFEVAPAAGFPAPAGGYDLVTTFDALHDLGDPLGAARRVRETLRADGTWLIVEPRAGDRVEDNLHPLGRLFYGASTYLCVPHAISEGGAALGAQAGPARLTELLTEAGFTDVRVVDTTQTNLVLSAR
ncbi:class I SAM-dependent methyltransferase [Dactylosporangium sp. NPDC000521]|uniref:class I SAM-dependent methyltransferase n=1 Tax=Dactylosporangium sp. NPDC000521 TaxID=3363975 RepID=UPI0036819FDC